MAQIGSSLDTDMTPGLSAILLGGLIMGSGACFSALISGDPIWLALVYYSLFGMIGTISAAVFLVALQHIRSKTNPMFGKIGTSGLSS